MSNLLEGLKAVVQYRRKEDGIEWVTMAAFDLNLAAKIYANNCSSNKHLSHWEYKVVDINPPEDIYE